MTGEGPLNTIGGITFGTLIEFTGNITVVTADGHSTTQSVDGAVPAEYTVSGTAMSCVFQNKGRTGSLTVTITKDGSQAGFATTSAAYGVVSVAIP